MASRRIAMLGALVAAALALAGCNYVLTVTALFTPTDAAGAPALKPGYWASPYCTTAQAAARSANCSNGYEITSSALRDVGVSAPLGAGPPQGDNVETYLLVAGDPMVMQIAYTNPAVSAEPGAYVFVAIKPTALDSDGRIVDAEVWPVLCGPPAPPPRPGAPSADDSPPSTDHPFPGMTLDDVGCVPDGKAEVLNAAKASRASADAVLILHWVAVGPP